MTTTELTIDGVALSTAVPSAILVVPTRPLVGDRRDVFVEIPGRAGSVTFPEEPGDRSIEFSVHIQAAGFEERRTAVEALADWIDTRARAQIVVGDRPDRYHEGMLENEPNPEEWLTTAAAKLRFRVGPYALAVTPSTESISVSGSPDSGSFVITDTIDAEPIIEITPTNGTLATFQLTINGDTLTYSGPTVADDNTVTISTISDTVTTGTNGDTMLTGAYTGAIIMSGVGGTFPLLVPGTNEWTLIWTGTATAITLDITWRRRYR